MKVKLLFGDNQQGLIEIKYMLQHISSGNHQHYETELSECVDGDDDLLLLHSDDSVSKNEKVRAKPKIKHVEAISSFSTCLKWAEENEPN